MSSTLSTIHRLLAWPGSFFRRETPEFLDKKFEDHRAFSVAMYTLGTVLGPSLWVWDYVTDPVGAQQTLGLRALFLFFAVFPFAFRHVRSRRVLALASVGAMLSGEYVFGEILNRLHDGLPYGYGGYLIFMYTPLLLFPGFSLTLNLVYLLLVAATPQLLATQGLIHGFEHRHYAVLVWPTVVTLMLGQVAIGHNYWRRYQSERELMHASNTDPLTGVSNRRQFTTQLQQEVTRARRFDRPVSLLMLDIDHFKKVNDAYGYPTGDRVICLLADICRKASRAVDVVARVGGEEFAILLPETDLEGAVSMAERIREAVEQAPARSAGGEVFHFTVSIGVAEQAPTEDPEGALVRKADAALYQAKTSGRNRVVLR